MSDNKVEFRVTVKDEATAPLGQIEKGMTGVGRAAGDAGRTAAPALESVAQGGKKAAEGVSRAADASSDLARKGAPAAGKLRDVAEAASKTARSADAAGAGVERLRDLLLAGFGASQIMQAAAEMEQLEAGLQAVTGSASAATTEMEFVRRMADLAGVDVAAAGRAWLGLSAAVKGTAVEGEPARRVFESVTVAMARAGKSSAETQNALLALSQMASKGVVSMEELRGQLGEALPGALQAAANGLGITTQDLIKLTESGQLAASDLFPALAKGLDELYAGAPKAQTLSQELTGVRNAFVQMVSDLGKAGGLDAMKLGAEVAQAAFALFGDTLIQVGQLVGTVSAAVATMDFSQFRESLAQIEAESRVRLQAAAANNEVLAKAVKRVGVEAGVAASEQAKAGAAAGESGQAAAAAAPSIAALAVQYGKVREEIKGNLELAEKELQATKARGEAAVAQAKASGDEAELRKAVAKAAQDEAAATAALAQQRSTEVEVLRAELAAREALLAQQPKVDDARKKELEDLRKLIGERQLDADKSAAQAAAAKERARAQSEEVQSARAAVESTQTLAAARRLDTQASIASLTAQRELARQVAETAAAYGNEDLARAARVEQLQFEIELVKARATAARVEAEGSIAVAQAKLAEMDASGQLSSAKRTEIEASIRLARAKIREADAMYQSTGALERQLAALLNGEEQHNKSAAAARRNGQAQRDLASDLDEATAAQERANAAAERAAERERKRLGVDKEGFVTDKNGGRLAAGSDLGTLTGIRNFLKSAGLNDLQATAVAREFGDSRGDVPYFDNPGMKKYGGDSISTSLLRAAERVTFADPAAGTPTPTGTTHTVTINLAGRAPVQIGTASARDAQALTAWLRELQDAAARTSG